jgi:hypothetical protein
MNQLNGKQIKDDSITLNKLTGGDQTFSGGTTLNFNTGSVLTISGDSILTSDSVVNKQYVDSVAQGLDVKDSVVIRTFDDAIVLSGEQTIQSIVLVDGDRVLVNKTIETDDSNIYIVRVGSWEVAPDAIAGDTLTAGSFVFIESGDFANNGYVLITTDDNLAQSSPLLSWTKFTGSNLPDTGVVADTYGDQSTNTVPTFTVDPKGRITSASSYALNLTIGAAEDGSYTDGIFNDFTVNTPVGTAVDRFNEVLLLLAPAPPKDWNNTITSLSFVESPRNARTLTSGTTINNLYTDNTPTLSSYSGSQNIGIGEDARVTTGVFELLDNGVSLETFTLDGENTVANTTGYLRHSASVDTYDGQAGKAGFWTGITSFSFGTTAFPSIIASIVERTVTLTYPGNNSPVELDYYIDDPLTVGISNASADFPAMGRFISGLPSLSVGDSITNIAFDIENVASFFYSPNDVWQIQQGVVNSQTGDPDAVPTTNGETGVSTGNSTTIRNAQFSDTSVSFSIRGRNSIGVYGSTETVSSNTTRIDTVSDESNRFTSGAGSYPTTGFGNNYDSTQSLLTGSYVNELLLINGTYEYPTGDYTAFDADNYDNATGTRFATFRFTNAFTDNSAFTLNINNSSGITQKINESDMLLEVKIEGSTSSSWVDADSGYGGTGNPGSGADGVASVVVASSTPTSRRITFGSATYTGDLIVRIGFTAGSSKTFRSITVSGI